MIALVMLGAAFGAPARWWLDQFVRARNSRVFPLGTLTVNLLGCLLLGILTGMSASTAVMALVGTGFCGGFTTFSTFSFESVRMLQERKYAQVALYVSLSLGVGLLVATAGWYLGSWF